VLITTPDGRTLRVDEAGDPGGIPILVHSGTPSGALLYRPLVEDAARRGARLLGYARPGYAGSSPQPGRAVADAAADVEAIADALELDRLVVWGASGGGPHALACAALLPDRIAAAASLAGVAPYGADGLDWSAGMGQDNVVELEATLRGRDALAPLLERMAAEMVVASPHEQGEVLRSLLSPVDAAVLTGELAEYFGASSRDALAGGVEGWIEDDLAFVAPWGIELDAIAVPVLLWHGRQDRFVPPAHGQWLAARIPGVEAEVSDADGHLTLLERRGGELHEWLLARAG
jgi:pimeloyl-ACP methyl ester carboxylesterase